MRIEVFNDLPPQDVWEAFQRAPCSADYFASRGWYEVFTRSVLHSGDRAQFVLARDADGAPAAMLPLWRHPAAGGRLGAQRLTSLANYYTCLYQPLISADMAAAERGIDALAQHLIDNRRHWSVLDLRPLPTDLPLLTGFAQAFVKRGFAVNQDIAFGNWYYPCAGVSFETYFATRRKKTRSTVRSKTTQLSKEFKFEISITTSVDGLEAALAAYNAVYGSSWKHAEPYPNFIPYFAHALASAQQLRLGVLRLDDEPAAAQLWFVAHGVAHIFKLAYDERFAQHSVGTLLTMKLFEHCLDIDKVNCVDFLSGDDEYKKHWMTDHRQRIGMEIINTRSPHGCLLTARRALGRLKRRQQS